MAKNVSSRLSMNLDFVGAGSGLRTLLVTNFKKLDSVVPLATGAAVANATDNATAITQLNALLASLRTAGVIAST